MNLNASNWNRGADKLIWNPVNEFACLWMKLIARILNLKNRYQSLCEFECTLIDLSGEKMKLSGKTYIIIIIVIIIIKYIIIRILDIILLEEYETIFVFIMLFLLVNSFDCEVTEVSLLVISGGRIQGVAKPERKKQRKRKQKIWAGIPRTCRPYRNSNGKLRNQTFKSNVFFCMGSCLRCDVLHAKSHKQLPHKPCKRWFTAELSKHPGSSNDVIFTSHLFWTKLIFFVWSGLTIIIHIG